MSFVSSFLVERKTLDSVELPSDDDKESQKGTATENQDSDSDYEINSTDIGVSKMTTDDEIPNEDDTSVGNRPKHIQAKKGRILKKPRLPVQSASAKLMSRLLDSQSIIPQRCEHDEIDRFFLNISETVKLFSPYHKAMAKNKIFNIVSEMELEQLAPPSFTTSPHNTYTSSTSTFSSAQANGPPVLTSELNMPVNDLKIEYM